MTDDTGDWFLWSGGLSLSILLISTIGGISPAIQRRFNAGAISAILLLVLFGTWGLFTAQGQKQFPEMSAMLPYFALLFAVALLILLVVFNLLWHRTLRVAR